MLDLFSIVQIISCDSRSSQIFSAGITVHGRGSVVSPWRTRFPSQQQAGWAQLNSSAGTSAFCRNMWRKSCLETLERSVSRLSLWAPTIPTSSSLWSKVSFGLGDTHLCLCFSRPRGYLKPCFALTHWLFAWAELQLMLHWGWTSSVFGHVLKQEMRLYFPIIICLLCL